MMAYSWEAQPDRGIFFGLQVYERVGISLVEVYKRMGKSVIWVCEKAQKHYRVFQKFVPTVNCILQKALNAS